MKKEIYYKILSLLAFFILVVPISNFSLWIDEGTTAFFASINSGSNLFSYLLHYTGSEAQMPGYIIYIWLWAKVFGLSEIALRAANIPFCILFILNLYRSSLTNRIKIIILLLVALNPFIWYNMNEARNTVIVFFLAFIIIINLFEYFNNGQKIENMYIIVITLIIGLIFNLLFYFLFIPIIYLTINYIFKNKLELKKILSDLKVPILITLLSSILILFYYFFTLMHGAGGMRQRPSLSNLGEVLYEFGGFLGLGPARNAMRDKLSLKLFMIYKNTLIPYLGIIIITSAVVFFLLRKEKKINILFNNNYLIAFCLSLMLFFIVSYLIQFRFWGRHLAFAYPLLILFLASIIDSTISLRPLKIFYLLLSALFIFWALSGFHLRFNEEYQKDNYKLAVQKVLMLARNKNFIVIWAGYDLTAEYYGLYFSDSTNISTFPKILKVYNKTILKNESTFNDKKKLIVLFKKYDLFDPDSYLRDYISKNNYAKILETQDFIIYEQKD
jgi:hypothetical protein